MFITSILEFISGGICFTWLRRRKYRIQDMALAQREWNIRRAQDDLNRREIVLHSMESDPLSKVTVQDALNRETRAKAALRAVLLKSGCSEAQVSDVMDSVEGAEDGDGV